MEQDVADYREDVADIFGKEVAKEARRIARSGRKMNLKSDVGFKLFFCNDTEESRTCLRLFLTAATGRTVTEANVTNGELLPEFIAVKYPRLDVNCTFDGGQRADIELQLTRANDDQLLRSVYYACKLYSGALKEGMQYTSAPNTYQIFLIDFDLFNDGKFYHRGMFRLDGGSVMTDRLQIRFFGFPALEGNAEKQADADLPKVRNWCRFIEGCNDQNVLDRLAQDTAWQEEYSMAVAASSKVSEEERAWAYHLSLDRAETDYNNEIMLAAKKAREEAVQQYAYGMARRMLSAHEPVEKVSEYSGLSVEEIHTLQGM